MATGFNDCSDIQKLIIIDFNMTANIKTRFNRLNSVLFNMHTISVCLLGFNVVFKHLRSYRDGTYLSQWYFDQCAAT